jgi:hypothetical protein
MRRDTVGASPDTVLSSVEHDPMRLPKFWHDYGRWNDADVTVCILLALLSWALVAWQLGSFRWAAAGAILAPLNSDHGSAEGEPCLKPVLGHP